MPGEDPNVGDRGHVTPLPGTNAGPVIDRLWAVPPRTGGGGGPVPTRTIPSGYRQWPTRRLGAMLGAVSGWLPFAALAAVWAGAVMYGAHRSRGRLRGARRKSDKMRDQARPEAVGYELDRETLTPTRRVIDTSAPGDYGADPIGDGLFRMVPSGDIVDFEERNRRLKKPLRGAPRRLHGTDDDDDDTGLTFTQRFRRGQRRAGIQTYTEGKWTPFRAGERVTTMIVETPAGVWQAKVHKDGSWSVRGPDPDNEAHYGSGEVTADTDRELVTLAKKQARAFLKARLG
jgi:hypothetical protein